MMMGYPLGLVDAMHGVIRDEARERERAERKARAKRARRR